LKTLDELRELNSNIPLNLLIIDTVSHRLSSLAGFLETLADGMVILITSEKPDRFMMENLPKSVFDCIEYKAIQVELPNKVDQALERYRYKNELKLMNQSRDLSSDMPRQTQTYARSDTEMFAARCDPLPSGRYVQEKVLVNFARMLTVSFDMRKLLEHFMDSVMEIARVSKMSVMLRDKTGFCVKTQYGLDPYIADNLLLRQDSAIVEWLTKTGRIMNRPVNFLDSRAVKIKNEMDILQCAVSFPMIYKGKLIGIFNIDNKITEEPFYREELEIIYVFCNYLAAAVKDIDLYQQMWYQKEFNKNMLSSMNSGMVAIDNEEKITIFNQYASEILGLNASEMIGRDLRALPSPLGDILYETMVTDNSYRRHEVTVHPTELPIGINSYRLLDEQQNPIGAGIIFSDLSDSRKLEMQNRRAEKLKAVNDLMAKIAHEVRNPLTSIQTYAQLLNEKLADDDMNQFYVDTVQQSIQRLDSLIDKLVTFSSTQDYNFLQVDVNDLLVEASDMIEKNMPDTHKFSKQLLEKVFYINADKKQLAKAIYYLIINVVDRTPDGTFINIITSAEFKDNAFVEIKITYGGEESGKEEEQNLLKPLLDIDHLGKELNVPISDKIIEGHDGSLEIKKEGNVNIFFIRLPILDRRSSRIPIGGGDVSG
jgi:PAS domain S-box-containing protein